MNRMLIFIIKVLGSSVKGLGWGYGRFHVQVPMWTKQKAKNKTKITFNKFNKGGGRDRGNLLLKLK